MKRLLVLLPLVLLLSACNPAAAWEALWSDPVAVVENCSGTTYVDGQPVNYNVKPGFTTHYGLDTATQTRSLKVVCGENGELVGAPTLIIFSTTTEDAVSTTTGFTDAMRAENNLVNPALFDADDNAAGHPAGYHDIGVNPGQIGIVFGYHLKWNGFDAMGGGCDLVVLPPGWYENFSIEDGRYEVYNVPSSDYEGWVEVLVSQRVKEQAEHYACPTTDYHVRVFTADPLKNSAWTIWR